MNDRFFTTLIGFGKVAFSMSNDKKMAKFIKYQTHAQVLKSNKKFCWNAVVEPDKEKSELVKDKPIILVFSCEYPNRLKSFLLFP